MNHEKSIEVDNACANLAMKHNLLYLSAYQLIRREIQAESELGKALNLSKRKKVMDFSAAENQADPFDEANFSAVHFD